MSPAEMAICLSIILFVSIFMFILIYRSHDQWFCRVLFIFSITVETIILVASVITLCLEPQKLVSESETKEDRQIVAILGSTTRNESGDFLWGGGKYVTSAGDTYRYFYETADGIKQEKISASNVAINPTDGNPILRVTTKETTTELKWWGPYYSTTTEKEMSYEFLIPEDHIATKSNLN